MVKGGIGGSNTRTGLHFEGKVDIVTFLGTIEGYKCQQNKGQTGKSKWFDIYYLDKYVASSFQKHALYLYLNSRGVKWEAILSKQLLPDDAMYVVKNNTVFIIEVKYQETSGSVDEKLQTCDFKLKQYKKLFAPLNYEVEYIYILSDWFRQDGYKDVRDYIIASNCKYYFEYLPLDKIGMPMPK